MNQPDVTPPITLHIIAGRRGGSVGIVHNDTQGRRRLLFTGVDPRVPAKGKHAPAFCRPQPYHLIDLQPRAKT